MNDPPSHPSVSVEETENGYIVHAGSAVARISKTIAGYAVDVNSQVLKEEGDLSSNVIQARKSAYAAVQLSPDSTDDTRLILHTKRFFQHLVHAVEMVCGFRPENFPEKDEWKLLSAWRSERDEETGQLTTTSEPLSLEGLAETEAVPSPTDVSDVSLEETPQISEEELVIQIKRVETEYNIHAGIASAVVQYSKGRYRIILGSKIYKPKSKPSFPIHSSRQNLLQGNLLCDDPENPELEILSTSVEFASLPLILEMIYGRRVTGIPTIRDYSIINATFNPEIYGLENLTVRTIPNPNAPKTVAQNTEKTSKDKKKEANIVSPPSPKPTTVIPKKTETLQSKNLPELRQKLSVNDVKKPSMSETLFWKRVDDSANHPYTSQIQEKTTNSLQEKYKQIFAESYPNGITITNRLQLRKLSREFQTVNPDFTTLEKEEAFALVTQIVQEIGVFCGENVWIPESSISINEDILNKIISYISTNLETFPIVDINRIYSDFRIWLPSSISSVQILNEILKQKLTKGYYFFENCVSNLESGSWKFVIKRVLKEYLLSCGEAVHISQIEEEFPHASQNLLREALADVKAGFVGGGRSQNYAHVGIFELTDDVIKDIQNLLLENMDENTSSITTERIEQLIHESYPELFSTYIDRNMLQEILEYYLSDVFEFRRGAVTLPGAKKRSATDIVIQHFGKKTIFTLQDVYDYIEEHHYSVAIMGVLLPLLQEHNFLRVDAQTFVSAKAVLISNDVYETISVKLSHSLYRGYICSDKIADIFSYPFISEWPMNPYLLESIVRVHGSKMRPPLQVIDYYTGPEKPRGIIVKKNGKFSTHDDVIHDLLLKRHEENPFDSVDEAIQFLKSEKYMERKTNSINEICKTIINTK